MQVVVQTVTEFTQFRVNWLHRVNWFTAAHHHRYHNHFCCCLHLSYLFNIVFIIVVFIFQGVTYHLGFIELIKDFPGIFVCTTDR